MVLFFKIKIIKPHGTFLLFVLIFFLNRPGKYIGARDPDGVSCAVCPGGRFQNERGAIECKYCPQGYYQSEEEAAFCPACDLGSFMSTTQAIVCKTCPAGRYGDVTALECASFCVKQCKGCVTGRYSAEKGVKADTACLKCSQGTFSEVDGRSSLQDCKLCRQGTNFNKSFLLSHVYIFIFSYLKISFYLPSTCATPTLRREIFSKKRKLY